MTIAEREEVEGPGIRLHRPDGTWIYVNPKSIRTVREPLTTEQGKATIIFNTGANQSTQETVDEVMKLISEQAKEDKDGRP